MALKYFAKIISMRGRTELQKNGGLKRLSDGGFNFFQILETFNLCLGSACPEPFLVKVRP